MIESYSMQIPSTEHTYLEVKVEFTQKDCINWIRLSAISNGNVIAESEMRRPDIY